MHTGPQAGSVVVVVEAFVVVIKVVALVVDSRVSAGFCGFNTV